MAILQETLSPALGYVTTPRGTIFDPGPHTVEVTFLDIATNPPQLRGQKRTFYVDLNPDQFDPERPVLARWQLPRTTANGELQVDNVRCIVKPLEQGLDMIPPDQRPAWAAAVGKSKNGFPGLNMAIQNAIGEAIRTAPGEGNRSKPIDEAQIPDTFWKDTFTATPVPMPGAGDELLSDSSYIRIGYVRFRVDSPLENIQVVDMTNLDEKRTLRSRSPILKGTQYRQQQVSLSLTFAGRPAMNQVLLPLLRQFKRVPFQPVVNHLLNDAGIMALTLSSCQVSTVPGYPHMLKVTLQCFSFNWRAYFPSQGDLDSLFCYPLLKLWIERPIDDRTQQDQPRLTPFGGPWNGRFAMLPLDGRWLQQASEFPEKAEKAQRHNRTLETVGLALGSKSPRTGDWDTEGFVNREYRDSKLPPGQVPVRYMGMTTLFGRAVVSLSQGEDAQDYLFLRVYTLEAAERLARDLDVARVLKGEVEMLRQSRLKPGYGYSSAPRPLMDSDWEPEMWHLQNTASVSREDFEELLRKNPSFVEQGVYRGYYVFVLPATQNGGWSLRKMAKDKRIRVPPVEEQPQYTQDHAFQPSSLVVESISASVENTVAPLQVRAEGTPTHQFLGSTALYYKVTGKIQESDIATVHDFFTRVDQLAREFPGSSFGSPFGGFVRLDNELSEYLGTRTALPLTWVVETVEQFPGLLQFELTLVEYSTTQRNAEKLTDLNASLVETPIYTAPDGTVVDQRRESLNDSLQMTFYRNREFHRRLRAMELYPDLALPTYRQLRRWIEDINNDRVWNWAAGEPYNHRNPAAGPPDPDAEDYSYLAPAEGGTGWQWRSTPGDGSLEADVEFVPFRFKLLSVPGLDPQTGEEERNLNLRFADPDFYCAPSQDWGAAVVDNIVGKMTGIQNPHTDPRFALPPSAREYEFVSPYGEILRLAPGMNVEQTYLGGGTTPSGRPAYEERQPVKELQLQALKTQQIPARGSAPFTLDEQEFLQHSPFSPFSRYPGMYGQAGPAPSAGDAAAIPKRWQPGLAKLRQQSWWAAVDKKWRDHGISTFAWEHNVLRESGGNPLIFERGGTGKGLYQFSSPGVFSGLVQQFGSKKALEIATDPLLATDWFQHVEQRAIARVRAEANGDPYMQAYLFTKYVERPAARYVNMVHAQLAPYFGSAAPQTATAGSPAQAQQDAAVTQAYQELLLAFQRGYGFPGAQVGQWEDDGSGRPSHWIRTGWMEQITQTRITTSASAPAQTVQTEGSGYYWVKVEFLRDFAAGWVKAQKRPLLEKVPSDTGGLSTYSPNTQYLAENLERMDTPPEAKDVFFQPVTGEDLFHDLRRSLVCGRLLQAFPTFYVAIVDGGRPLRVWRLYDHVYGMMAVTQISVHRTRKGPVETAVVGFSNMYGHLTNQVAEIERSKRLDSRQSFARPDGTINVEVFARWFASWVRIDDETLNLWGQHVNSMMLKPGTRLHIRLGYGSDANELPVVFNGVVTEVPLDEGEVQVVALSDGIELTNDMPPTDKGTGGVATYQKTSWFGGGMNPRELIMMMLDPTKDWWQSIVRATTNTLGQGVHPFFYYDPVNRNPYGIEHFGKPIYDGPSRYDAEQGVNIYNPEFTNPKNDSWVWDSCCRLMQVHKWGTNSKLLGIKLQEATPWRVIEICQMSMADYVAYPAPFELRSTLFYGKPWFPFYYQYRETLPENADADPAAGGRDEWTRPGRFMKRKPFQQFHIVNSGWNLIGNLMRPDASQVFTRCQTVGTWAGFLPNSYEPEASWLWQVDEDIFDEFQRTRVIECGLYTTPAMKAGDAAADIASAFNRLQPDASAGRRDVTPGDVFLSRTVVNTYAQMELKNAVMEMYQGPFVLLGNAYIKPWDLLGVNDEISRLHGVCGVKEVVHTMSLETGFISQVTPDCLTNLVDFDGRDLYLWAMMVAPHFAGAFAMSRFAGIMSRQLAPRALYSSFRRVERYLKDAVRNETDVARRARLQKRLADFQGELKGIAGNERKTRALLEKLTTDTDWVDALKDAPGTLGAELRLNRDLRNLARGATVRGRRALQQGQRAADQWVQRKAAALAKEVTAAEGDLNKAEAAWKALAPADQKLLRGFAKEIRAGHLDPTRLSAAQQDGLRLLSEFEEAQAAFRAANRAVSTFGRVTALGEEAQLFLKAALSRTLSLNLIALAIQVGSAAVGQMVLRWAHTRQCLTIYPLKRGQAEVTAGINGHRGSVIGDPLGVTDQYIQFWADWLRDHPVFTGLVGIIPVVGDAVNALAEVDYTGPQLPQSPGPIVRGGEGADLTKPPDVNDPYRR